MSWSVEVDFGTGFTNLMAGRHVTNITKNETLHRELKSTVNYCHFEVTDKTIANSFLSTEADIPLVIQKDSVDWFVGIIRHNYNVDVGSDFDTLKVEGVDKSITLQKKIDQSLVYENYKVCDPTNKTISILHQLFYEGGFADTDLNLSLIDKTIDYFVVNASDELEYNEVISELLFEFGYVYTMGSDGVAVLHDLYPSSISGTAITDSDIEQKLSIKRQEHKYEGARIIWHSHRTLDDVIVFSDTTNGDENNKCNIEIAAGEYYPPNADTKDTYSLYGLPDYEIIIVNNETLDWAGIDVSLYNFTPGNSRALAEFTSATGGTLTKFDIRGDPVVRDLLDEHRSVRRAVAGTDKIKDFTAKYITTDTDADRLCNGLADDYNSYSLLYSFLQTEPKRQLQ